MISTSQKQVLKFEIARAVNWIYVLRAILFKLMSSFYCQIMFLRLKRFIKLFKSNLQALCFLCFNRRNLAESITLNWLNLIILSSSDFFSKIYTRTHILLNFCQHNNIYNTKKGPFSVIVIIRLYCTDLTLCCFSLRFLKMFYLQIAQTTHERI